MWRVTAEISHDATHNSWEDQPMSDMWIVLNTAIAVLAVVVFIVRFRFNPVVSLVLGAAYLGLATKLGVDKTVDTIAGGFGEIMAEVGLPSLSESSWAPCFRR
nr:MULTISPECIES: hypothetical protein [Rhodococcus]